MAIATPISLGLSWPLTIRHLLGVASHLLLLRCMSGTKKENPKKKYRKRIQECECWPFFEYLAPHPVIM